MGSRYLVAVKLQMTAFQSPQLTEVYFRLNLYKFRALDPIEYALDISLNARLFCAPYENLNDPFEGVFLAVIRAGISIEQNGLAISSHGITINSLESKKPTSVSDLPINKDSRVCSMCATMEDVRLWSHYAGGHKGIAIEVDLEEGNELHRVNYREHLKEFPSSILTAPTATDILKNKTIHWRYEQEYRIITEQCYYDVRGSISGVYVGTRTPDLMKTILKRAIFDDIPMYATKINPNTMGVERGEEIDRQ